MEPERCWEGRATLSDLLDRILDKGLVINADIVISVSGIPLVGISLRAVVAGMEAMLRYGMLETWDANIRAGEREHIVKEERQVINEGLERIGRVET